MSVGRGSESKAVAAKIGSEAWTAQRDKDAEDVYLRRNKIPADRFDLALHYISSPGTLERGVDILKELVAAGHGPSVPHLMRIYEQQGNPSEANRIDAEWKQRQLEEKSKKQAIETARVIEEARDEQKYRKWQAANRVDPRLFSISEYATLKLPAPAAPSGARASRPVLSVPSSAVMQSSSSSSGMSSSPAPSSSTSSSSSSRRK